MYCIKRKDIFNKKKLYLNLGIKVFFMNNLLIDENNIKMVIYSNNSTNNNDNLYNQYDNFNQKFLNLNNLIKIYNNIFLFKDDFLKKSKVSDNMYYFRFREGLEKTKYLLRKISNNTDNLRVSSKNSLENNNNINSNADIMENFKLELNKNNRNNLNFKINNKIRNLAIDNSNPCFLNGYYNNKTKITGTGNFENCYKQINISLGNKFSNVQDLSLNKTSVLLGPDFKDIGAIIDNSFQQAFSKQ